MQSSKKEVIYFTKQPDVLLKMSMVV